MQHINLNQPSCQTHKTHPLHMPIPSPQLDDRSFEQLLEEAKAIVARSECGWSDLSASDPGAVLLEAFAYVTGLLIYRMNRLPDKVFVELLRLMGVKLAPPAAARVQLRFSLAQVQSADTHIPEGTRVTLARAPSSLGSGSGMAEPPVFATTMSACIPAGALVVAQPVLAHHCVQVHAELGGVGTGLPRQSVKAGQPPIVAATGHPLDLIVGVEATPQELGERVPALLFEGKPYRIWRCVENFSECSPESFAYLADRSSGRITFAPAVRAVGPQGALQPTSATLAQVPAAGRQIRLWYRRGGGEDGNVAAHTLVVLRDPLRGVLVTNPEAATGGAASEAVENALLRGPQEMHSLRRAVTAGDFEALALHSSAAVARAKAFTQAKLWQHAPPGTVEVLLVPQLGSLAQRGGGTVTPQSLAALETQDVRQSIADALAQRRPLGTACLVNWVRYKTVKVLARVVVHRGEDPDSVRQRVLNRLQLTLNPLPTPLQRQGWPFGEPLRASHVYDMVLAEPGVSYVDRVRLVVDDVPDQNVQCVVPDPFQPGTWHAASGARVFRSLNHGDGWEAVAHLEGFCLDALATHPTQAGLLAVCARRADGNTSSQVHVSHDCGETWRPAAELAFPINELAWLQRNGTPVLLMATDKGLYELSLAPEASPLQLVVDKNQTDRGFYAVATFTDSRGGSNVAVAARQMGGIYLSRSGGATETFAAIYSGGEDIRVLGVQRLGVSLFLWAGITTAGNEQGKGCLRWELPSSPQSVESAEGWRALPVKWQGGSCRALAFDGLNVYAGTHFAGVAQLDSAKPDAGWHTSPIQCGLPMRGADKLFAPVHTVALNSASNTNTTEAAAPPRLMVGGDQGVYRSPDRGLVFECASAREFADKVALPPTWLFCSGEHDVVVSLSETQNG
jgi:hypothetical protein